MEPTVLTMRPSCQLGPCHQMAHEWLLPPLPRSTAPKVFALAGGGGSVTGKLDSLGLQGPRRCTEDALVCGGAGTTSCPA